MSKIKFPASNPQAGLLIALVILLCSILFLKRTTDEKSKFLTTQQIKWLEEHPYVRLSHCNTYYPIDFTQSDGSWGGFSADYTYQMADILGIQITCVPCKLSPSKLPYITEGKTDILSSFYYRDNEGLALYTDSYFQLPLLLFSSKENDGKIHSLSDLAGKTLGVSKLSNVTAKIKKDFPDIIIKECPTHALAYYKLSCGEIDACLSTLVSAKRKANHNAVSNVIVVGKTYINLDYGYAVRPDWPEFVEILNECIKYLDKKNTKILEKKWFDNLRGDQIITSKKYFTFVISFIFFIIYIIYLLVKREVSEAKIKKAKLMHEAKSRFFASMSHDIRNPLSIMVGMLKQAEASTDMEKSKEYIQDAIASSGILLRLLNEILDFSKIEAGKMTLYTEPHNLLAVIEEICTMFHYHSNPQVEFSVTIDNANAFPKYVLIDELKLQQVISNLISNAIKFTEQGSVKVTVRWVKTSIPHKLWSERDFYIGEESSGSLLIDVVDTGIGISDEKLKSLFNSYEQESRVVSKKLGGSGLGLSICKELVGLMGGKIKAHSFINKGSTFSILFPLEEVSKPNEDNPISRDMTKPILNEILIVDDDELGRKLGSLICKEQGVRVCLASNGQQGLAKMCEQRFDLTLMDIEMPLMSGMTAIKQYRAWEKENLASKEVIVALTGHKNQESELLSYGFCYVVEKPLTKESLQSLLGKINADS